MQRFFYLIIVLILILSFFLRVETTKDISQFDSNIYNPGNTFDMGTYHTLSTNIIKNGYSSISEYYYQPFYYAVFLVFVKKIFGCDNIRMIIVCQCIIAALSILFTSLSAKILWGYKAGLITCLIMAFSQIHIFYTSYMLIEILQSLWISLILFLSLLAYRKKDIWTCILLGLVLGCAILRGNVGILAVFLITFFSVVYITDAYKNAKSHFSGAIIRLLLLIFFIILPAIPFCITNSIHQKKITGPSTASTIVFMLGNAPDSIPGGLYYSYIYKDWIQKKDHGISDFYHYCLNNKLSYADFLLNKAILFWDYREIPNNANINKMIPNSFTLKYLAIFRTPFIIILGLSGILLSLFFVFKRIILIIPLLITITYWLSIIVFYNLDRFRLPIIPLLCVFSAGFICFIINEKHYKSKKGICVIITLLICSTFITYFLYDIFCTIYEPFISKYIRPAGLRVSMEKKTMYTDSTSSFDYTVLLKLKDKVNVEKRFIINEPVETCNITLPILVKTPSVLKLKVNGQKISADLSITGLGRIEVTNVPIIEKVFLYKKDYIIINLNIEYADGEVYFFLDKQRNYGRTCINDKITDKELNISMFLDNKNYFTD